MKALTKFVSLVLVAMSVLIPLSLTGCHGQSALPIFEVPEEFDTTKHYDIVFWSKNESNPTQNAIYDKAIENFKTDYGYDSPYLSSI